MGRSPCCSKVGLRRGPWSTKEDALLTNYIQQNGEGQWRALPKNAGLLRCGKSCRLRWMNYLRPGIKRGNISEDEEDLIVRMHRLLGNRWSLIAGRLPGRTDNEIKNHWNTHLLKKLAAAGEKTHRRETPESPKTATSGSGGAAGKKRKQRKTAGKEDPAPAPAKTKVYLPKPIRVSSAFSRTSSHESLSSDGGEAAADQKVYVMEEWPPLFEVEDYGDEFLLDGIILPAIERRSDSMSGDVEMLDRVYDEYLQLL